MEPGVFYTAKVVCVKDEDYEGKIEVYCPKLMSKQKANNKETSKATINNSAINCTDDECEQLVKNKQVTTKDTKTAYPMLMNSSCKHGFMVIPEVDDLVLITMLDNDPSQIYYIGSPYKVGVRMKDIGTYIEDENNFKDPKKYTKMKVLIKSINGNFIAVNDNDNKHSIVIKSKHNGKIHRIKINNNDNENNIQVTTNNGHKFILDDKNKDITLKSTNNNYVKIDDNNNDITMHSNNTINITANGNIKIQGARIDLN